MGSTYTIIGGPLHLTTEFGVRTYGGWVATAASRHLAEREVERRIEAGERNVWLVKREVSAWQAAGNTLDLSASS